MNLVDKSLLSLNNLRQINKDIIEKHKKQIAKFRLPKTAKRFIERKQFEIKSKHKLTNAIPLGRKYRFLKRMAVLFEKNPIVENYRLFQVFSKKVRDTRNKLKKPTKKDYYSNQDTYNIKIKNRIRELNKLWKVLSFKIRFTKDKSKIAFAKKIQK